MERFTISLDDELAAEFDELIRARGYENRSEAVRDMLRGQIEAYRSEHKATRHCVATLSYLYNHHERDLAERLTRIQHDHHNLAVSTMHAHLDHDNCIEAVILRGPTEEVRAFANALSAERGVRHSQLNLVSADIDKSRHAHPHDDREAGHSHRHDHLKPKS